MAAGKYNFIVEQGSQYVVTFRYKQDDGEYLDLTGYRVRLSVKDHITDTDFVYRATSSAASDADHDEHFSKSPQVGATLGEFSLTIPSATTSAFSFNQGVYDLELVDAFTAVTRILEGKFKVKPQVSV